MWEIWQNYYAYIIGGAVVVIALAIWLIVQHRRKVRYRARDKKAHSKASRILKRFALLNFYKELDDFSFTYKSEKHHIDHVLCGSFGILLVQSSGMRGELYGSEKDGQWIHYFGDKKGPIDNLGASLEKTAAALRGRFGEDKIYKLKFFPAIVFWDRKLELFLSSEAVPVMKLRGLRKFLSQEDFIDKGPFDAAKLYERLKSYDEH